MPLTEHIQQHKAPASVAEAPKCARCGEPFVVLLRETSPPPGVRTADRIATTRPTKRIARGGFGRVVDVIRRPRDHGLVLRLCLRESGYGATRRLSSGLAGTARGAGTSSPPPLAFPWIAHIAGAVPIRRLQFSDFEGGDISEAVL